MNAGDKTSRKLKESQLLAVEMLVAGQTGRWVAKNLGVCEETVSRWRQEPVFMAALNRRVGDQREAFSRRAEKMLGAAMDGLAAILVDPASSPNVRIAAAAQVFKILSPSPLSAKQVGWTDPVSIEQERKENERSYEQSQRLLTPIFLGLDNTR